MIQSTYNEQIHNTELQFLKQLTYQPLETGFLRSARLNNYSTLSQLLKVKNQKYGFSQTVKQQGQSWIRKKGADINKKAVDLNTFVDRVKNEKQLIIQKKQQKKCQSQCQFYIPHLCYDNQNQYIAKNFQFGVVNTIQSIYNIDKNKGNLAKRILNKRTINRINHVQTYLQRLPIINMQVRNSIKKLQYLEATKVVLSIGKIIKGSKWAEYYKNSTKQSFWEILTTQVSFLQTYKGDLPFQNIAIISLKMVEKEYDRTLPHTPDSITNYLTNNYLGKMRNAFDVDGSKGPNWGTSFVLYRAGRLQQFYFVIDDPELKSYFQKSQASIREGNPQKISQKQEQDDLFYNQLIYALRGQAKCSSKALSQPDSLDVVWVFLRNMAIYKSNYPTFMTLRNDLYESYRGPYINQLQIKNLFYLLAYGQIAQIGTNDIMDHDDYLHYLIAIYHSPVFELIQSDKKQLIQRKLTQNLVQYIQQLLCQHKDDYIRYMVLIPPSKIVEQISSIITSSHLIETLDWKYLAKMLNPDIYEKLTYLSLQKYAVFHQQYVHVAKKSCQLLGTNKMALELILEMLIKSLLSNISVSALQIQKGQQLAKDLLRRDENLFKKYGPVFRFFDQFIKLIVLVTERSQSKIYEFLRQSKFILIAETVRAEIKEAIDMLVQFKGFQCFILYLKYMVKAYGIGLKRLNQINDLRQLHYLTFVALSNLMKSQSYSQFYNLQSVKELFRTIEQNIKQFQ